MPNGNKIRDIVERGEAIRASRSRGQLWLSVLAGVIAILGSANRLRSDLKYLAHARASRK